MARVVVTGVSSYTGACIAQALAARGHLVVGLCRRRAAAYQGLAARRLALAAAAGTSLVFGLEASAFAEWVSEERLDAWVHHHHPMENFRSEAYDSRSAEAQVLASLPELTRVLRERGARLVVYSSTYFEAGEGGQPAGVRVTPYAALKARVHEQLALACAAQGLTLSRVVIPAPTGALENADRLTPQLLVAAERGTPFIVRSPESVMDLIPGEALAETYVALLEEGLDGGLGRTRRPSGLVISAIDWAERVDQRLARPLGWRLDPKVPVLADRGPTVRFQNPDSERVRIDWDAFFARYVADWRNAPVG